MIESTLGEARLAGMMTRYVVTMALLLTVGGCAPAPTGSTSRRVAVPEDAESTAHDAPQPRATTMPPKRIATH